MGKGFKLPRRMVRLVFDGDYAGAEVVVHLDVSLGLLMRFVEMQEVIERQEERLAEGKTGDAAEAPQAQRGRDLGDAQEILGLLQLFASAALVSWNLEADDCKPIPASAIGIMQIPPAFAQMLVEEWVEAAMAPPIPLVGRSSDGSTSGMPSLATVVV